MPSGSSLSSQGARPLGAAEAATVSSTNLNKNSACLIFPWVVYKEKYLFLESCVLNIPSGCIRKQYKEFLRGSIVFTTWRMLAGSPGHPMSLMAWARVETCA